MDETLQRKRREAKLSGDPADEAAAAREEVRSQGGLLAFLGALVGKSIFIEGARIDYRGTLLRVLCHPDGYPGGLVLAAGAERVSYFEKSGPHTSYTYVCQNEVLVPYEMIHAVNEGSFEGWRKK